MFVNVFLMFRIKFKMYDDKKSQDCSQLLSSAYYGVVLLIQLAISPITSSEICCSTLYSANHSTDTSYFRQLQSFLRSFCFPSVVVNFYTQSLMPTFRTSKAAHLGRMICPKRFLEGRSKHFVAFWTDIGHMAVIVNRYNDCPRNCYASPGCKEPPNTFGCP